MIRKSKVTFILEKKIKKKKKGFPKVPAMAQWIKNLTAVA